MSGNLAFVEGTVLFETGPLCFLFPFLFIFIMIKIAKHCAETNNPTYLKATAISSFVPLVCFVIFWVLNMFVLPPLTSTVGVNFFTRALDIICAAANILSVSSISIFFKMAEFFGEPDSILLSVLMVVFSLPFVFGIAYSVRIFKKAQQNREETNID